jgi:tRNA dimethylallyltransferase
MSQQKIILVGGPTASGKSAFALDLARKSRGALINADAMQIYQGLPILSAQPQPVADVPHYLYAALDPAQASSAGFWLKLAKAAIAECRKDGFVPILVGGTGLYFKALLGGLADIPEIPAAIREQTEQLYATLGQADFRRELAGRDPASAAKLARNDRQRLIRAYEVALYTGHALDYWHRQTAITHDYEIEPHILLPPREELYAACDRRFKTMLDQGAIAEAKAFLQRRLPPERPAMKTLGLREIGAYLNGELTLDQAIAKAQQHTRNYAKRQLTWFRNQGFGKVKL